MGHKKYGEYGYKVEEEEDEREENNILLSRSETAAHAFFISWPAFSCKERASERERGPPGIYLC